VKIYTRTGDDGSTSFFGGGRILKSDARVAAYGDVDELSAAIGVAHAHLASWSALRGQLEEVQRVLFGIGGEIATRLPRRGSASAAWSATPRSRPWRPRSTPWSRSCRR